MDSLEITAHLVSPMVVPLHPVALDALLGAMVCERKGKIAGVGEWMTPEVPLKRSECGSYHLASVGHYVSIKAVLGHLHRRPVDGPARMHGGSKVRSINTGTGKNKAYRIPQPRELIGTMRWWAIGEASEVIDLLELVTHIGPKRSAGYGRVARWTVEDCDGWDGFPVLRPDGMPMRNIPLDTPGIGPGASAGWGSLSYPYWDESTATDVAQPGDVAWSGPS